MDSSDVLGGFSLSVRSVAADLAGQPVTAWELAGRLLSLHPDYGGSHLLPLDGGEGVRRTVAEWLALVERMGVRPADAWVIDGRMTLLGLARLEPELGAVFAREGLTTQLKRGAPVHHESEHAPEPDPFPEPADTLRNRLRHAALAGLVPGNPIPDPPSSPPLVYDVSPGTVEEAPQRPAPPAQAHERALRKRWSGVAVAFGAVAAGLVAARWLLGWFVVLPDAHPDEADSVEVTVFAPPVVSPRDSVLVQAFVHVPEEAAEAKAIALELDLEARRRAYRSLATAVRPGNRLVFELRMPGLTIEEPVAALVWRGRTEAVQFAVDIPPDAAARSVTGTLDVSLEGVPVGHVKFVLRVQPGADRAGSEPQGEHAHTYEFAFISYSSRDRDEVLARVQMLPINGIDYFQDVMALEPGDRWERRIEAGIDRCDLFLLFWSEHAKDSSWVKREVEHALARRGDDESAPPEIRPVILERVPPWNELSHLHFDDRVLYFMRRR